MHNWNCYSNWNCWKLRELKCCQQMHHISWLTWIMGEHRSLFDDIKIIDGCKTFRLWMEKLSSWCWRERYLMKLKMMNANETTLLRVLRQKMWFLFLFGKLERFIREIFTIYKCALHIIHVTMNISCLSKKNLQLFTGHVCHVIQVHHVHRHCRSFFYLSFGSILHHYSMKWSVDSRRAKLISN